MYHNFTVMTLKEAFVMLDFLHYWFSDIFMFAQLLTWSLVDNVILYEILLFHVLICYRILYG